MLTAIEIAKNDPLVPEVLAIITVPDVAFDFSLDTLTVHATRDDSVGLVFRQAKTSNPRLGADLILTCDLASRSVLVAHFLIGVSQAHALELHSITVDARDPLIEIYTDPRVLSELPDNYPRRFRRARLEHFWSYTHEDAAPLDPRELVLAGWPPELSEVPRWHYTGCSGAEWVAQNKSFVLQATQVGKALPGKPDSMTVLALVKNEIDLRTEVEHDIENLNKQG
ncbi:MAG: hypothetical protein HC853_11215 [Anaerolineae bacterium]|nr:hypothetical protein [Anaerolineae bacterium]